MDEPWPGYIYAIAPRGDEERYGWLPVLCLGERDHALYYTDLADEAEDSDPATWVSQWIELGVLRPAEGYQGGDGPFETDGYTREHTARRSWWIRGWSDQAAHLNAQTPPEKDS